MRSVEKAWAAGFFQGEGCVTISRGRIRNDGFQSLHLKLQVNQGELEPLEKLQEMFGGGICATKVRSTRHNQSWQWSISGKLAREAFEIMRPYIVSPIRLARFDAVVA